MDYQVDGWNNFCRVFELPEMFPNEYCFGGGIPVDFKMVDWFNPVPSLPQPAVPKHVWETDIGPIEVTNITHKELHDSLIPFLISKRYVYPGRKYLVLCDFGAAITFTGRKKL